MSGDIQDVPTGGLKNVKRLETEFAKTEVQLIEEQEPSTKLTVSNQILKTKEGKVCEVAADISDEVPQIQVADALSPSAPNHPVLETSPSFRLLHPGHVSNISDFWENIWKIEKDGTNMLLAKGGKYREQRLGNDENFIIDDEGEEINHLKETFFMQCRLLKAAEQENGKLKDKITSIESMNEKILKDLNEKSEKRENLVINLRAKLEKYEKDNSNLNDLELVKSCKILELEDKLTETALKLDVSRQENVSLNNKLKEVNSQLNNVEVDHTKLKDELSQYLELVKELKKQVVPMENIKQKMASIDEDVVVLKRRLQGSMRRKSVVQSYEMEELQNSKLSLPYCTSTKRRLSPIYGQNGSPAKIIKVADATVNERSDSTSVIGNKDETDQCQTGNGNGNITSGFENTKTRSLKNSRSRIGQDCKQQ